MKRKAQKQFLVTLTFRDENMPKMYQEEETESLANATVYHWLGQFAAIRSVTITDRVKQEWHSFTPAGYLFSGPVLA